MRSAVLAAACALRRAASAERVLLRDCALTLLAIYVVHVIVVDWLVRPFFPQLPLLTPLRPLPLSILTGWDGAWYKQLFEHYDRYTWPPLYPLTLRAVAFVFGFREMAFEKASLLVNVVSHAGVVVGVMLYLRSSGIRTAGAWLLPFVLLFYPGHNTFFASYAESLFLAVTVFAFVLWRCERYLPAAVLAGVASLIRYMGFFLCLALVLEQLLRSLLDRRLHVRGLAAAGLSCLFFGFWNLYIYAVGSTDAVQGNSQWVTDLVQHHVTPGMDPRLWTFRYIVLPGHKEWIYFWASIVVAAYCLWRRLYLEAFYILLFDASLAFYTYRPFSWSRWASVLFPWALLITDLVRRRPQLQVALAVCFLAISFHYQIMLFLPAMGEP
jgi:hypothetical protein